MDDSHGGRQSSVTDAKAARAAARLAWIESWVPEGILVELGWASGEFLTIASADGYEAYGVTPYTLANPSAEKGVGKAVIGSLAEWGEEFAAFSIDAIAMFDVLAHVGAIVDLLVQCHDALTPGGMLFTEVPNAGSHRAQELDPTWPGWHFGWHQWHVTPESLGTLVSRAGLQVVEMHPTTARMYATNAAWQEGRASERRAGNIAANLDLIRLAARRSM